MAQAAPVAPAQVLAVGLHKPVAHTAIAVAAEQVPSCSPSFGMGVPPASFAAQTHRAWSQNWALGQSWSLQQLPLAVGTQRPLELQALLVHCEAEAHEAPAAAEQVLVKGLHAPLTQTAAAAEGEQVPSCRPSVAMAAPGASFAWQVADERSQYCAALQSASTSQAPGVVAMHTAPALQKPLWQTVAAVAVVQGPSVLPKPHVPAALHTPDAQSVAALACEQGPTPLASGTTV